ncbi:hypothetical protein ZWY2020_050221 [Hordeum vulgare]|nr:hypothetical protein ZWY2020_050221 [Hordeum vulgare]
MDEGAVDSATSSPSRLPRLATLLPRRPSVQAEGRPVPRVDKAAMCRPPPASPGAFESCRAFTALSKKKARQRPPGPSARGEEEGGQEGRGGASAAICDRAGPAAMPSRTSGGSITADCARAGVADGHHGYYPHGSRPNARKNLKDPKTKVLPSTMRGGKELPSSSALDSPSVMSKFATPPPARNFDMSHVLDDAYDAMPDTARDAMPDTARDAMLDTALPDDARDAIFPDDAMLDTALPDDARDAILPDDAMLDTALPDDARDAILPDDAMLDTARDTTFPDMPLGVEQVLKAQNDLLNELNDNYVRVITRGGKMTEEPLYPEGHPKRIDLDSQGINVDAPSHPKKKKDDRNLHVSSPNTVTPEEPNDISASDAETQSGDEHEPGDNMDSDVHNEVQPSNDKDVEIEPTVNPDNPQPKRYDKNDFAARKHGKERKPWV